jgi:MFS family permease
MKLSAIRPTRVRYGVLAFCCILSMITYLDRVCFGTVAPFIQKEFGLSDGELGWLFTAFALSYAVFEVPTGWLGDKYGARMTLIRIVLWWSIFTVLTGMIYPSMLGAGVAYFAMLAVRFLFGMGEAGAYPNIARAFHNWFPFHERAFAKGAVWMAGRFAGGITGLVVLALVIETGTLMKQEDGSHLPYVTTKAVESVVAQAGATTKEMLVLTTVDPVPLTHWRHAFWIFGALGVVWCVAWYFWYRDRPEDHGSVNAAELALIQEGESHGHTKLVVPWGRLFRSANLWILCAMYFCGAYGWYFNITWLPKFLSEEFKVTKEPKWSAEFWQYSIMQGMPLLLGAAGCLIGGYLSDLYIRRTGNRKWGRRLFGVIGHALCATCYFLAIFMESAWGFVFAVGFAAFWNDMTMGASWASCLDIGKRYSGIVAGCMNTVGNLGGAVAGALTGWILDLASSKSAGWTINFFTFAGVYVVAVFLWLMFDPTKPVAPDDLGSSEH